jgi:hypothetical protein
MTLINSAVAEETSGSAQTAPITAAPRAPVLMTSPMVSRVIPPIAMTGIETAAATAARF